MVIGKLLGNRYEIQEKVGGGGMSLVYRAKDIFLNRVVAVKVLREQFANDEEFVKRFRREAQAVASLSHSNIVSIYDVGIEGEIYYLVMELVEGNNLKEIIKEQGPLPLDEAVRITQQICDALQHAHEHQIIHRDVKPHNILLTKKGRAKVTDFGIARAVSTATVTHTKNIMGSVHYFSPEQAKGEIADEKSDIYALGVVLYEMLTGTMPFEGDSPISVALKKINEDPVLPSTLNEKINHSVEQVILRAMSRNPQDRYDSVRQFKEDLTSAFLHDRLEYKYEKKEVSQDTIKIPPLAKQDKQKKNELAAPLKVWTWVMLTLVIIGFILGMYLSATVIARGEVMVPNVEELPAEKAKAVLESNDLFMEIDRKIHHPSIPEGSIVSQEPENQEIVKKKSTVKVVISEGPTMVKVPDLYKTSLISAEVTLSNKGLAVGKRERVYHSIISSGQVIQQDPTAGKEVMQGTEVDLIISRGPEPIWVILPDLSGKSLPQVKAILEEKKLVLGFVQPEMNYSYDKDIVIRQDPGPESEILQGSTVNLVVSSGPGVSGEQANVKVILPNNGTVKIVVEDEKGRNKVYENFHRSGETFERLVRYYGQGFIEVYVNDKLIERQAVE